jgi:hypothetical protein
VPASCHSKTQEKLTVAPSAYEDTVTMAAAQQNLHAGTVVTKKQPRQQVIPLLKPPHKQRLRNTPFTNLESQLCVAIYIHPYPLLMSRQRMPSSYVGPICTDDRHSVAELTTRTLGIQTPAINPQARRRPCGNNLTPPCVHHACRGFALGTHTATI